MNTLDKMFFLKVARQMRSRHKKLRMISEGWGVKSRQGFGVLELLVFAAIFSVIAISFLSILVVVTRIQVRQIGASQVNKESIFLLQVIQRYVETSSLVDMPSNIPTSTLTLKMSSSTLDPTKFFFNVASGTISIQEGPADSFHQLNSPKVTIPSLQFTKYSNPPGHDSVKVSFTVAFNTQNITQYFQRSYVTAIARVSAATFDSGIYPAAGATDLNIGGAGNHWNSINGVIYFNSSNWVGIGPAAASPNSPVHIDVQGRELRVSNGDIYIEGNGASQGLILKSPNSTCYRVKITNTGNFATSTVGVCP